MRMNNLRGEIAELKGLLNFVEKVEAEKFIKIDSNINVNPECDIEEVAEELLEILTKGCSKEGDKNVKQ